jgi:hypothetical protein
MADKQQTPQPSYFIVDPARDGVANALWKFATGSGAVESNKFRFNADDGVVRSDCRYGIFEFPVTFPLTGVQTPTNLVDDISFGLKGLGLSGFDSIQLFVDKSANKAYFRTVDEFGTQQETEITWDTGWNGAVTIFRFGWSKNNVSIDVLANGGTSWSNLANHSTNVPSRPLNPFVTVVGAENFDVNFISVKNAQSVSTMLI